MVQVLAAVNQSNAPEVGALAALVALLHCLSLRGLIKPKTSQITTKVRLRDTNTIGSRLDLCAAEQHVLRDLELSFQQTEHLQLDQTDIVLSMRFPDLGYLPPYGREQC